MIRNDMELLEDFTHIEFEEQDWWTGVKPMLGQCPGLDQQGHLHSLPLPDTHTCSRQDVLDYFDNGWALSEVLFSSLLGNAAPAQTIFTRSPYHGLRHPMMFYYGHPVVFYVNKLRLAGLLSEPVNPEFEHLFEIGVDEMSWDDMEKNQHPWPPLSEVHDYRRTVYGLIRNILETHPGLEPGHAAIDREHPLWACFMGFEHERIHIETSSVLIRELPLEMVHTPEHWPALHPSARPLLKETDQAWRAPIAGEDYPHNDLLHMEAASVHIGKPSQVTGYGWDNEYGQRELAVRPFAASRYLISNGEFYEFVRAGGYTEARYWGEDGWRWRKHGNRKWPTFWVSIGPSGLHHYALRSCFELIEMPWSWPVVVNYYEAQAYCNFRSEREGSALPFRVITEAEHHRLRGAMEADPAFEPVSTKRNLALMFGAEGPVDAGEAAGSGAHDLFGNVWEWCEDDFNPLPGFAIDPLYEDFSSPCFDGKHNMIMGGSFISTGDEASRYARFHFRPHFFQHAGFRLVRSDDGDPRCDAIKLTAQEQTPASAYEDAQILEQYLLLHYGDKEEQVPHQLPGLAAEYFTHFPQRCARLLIEAADELGIDKQRVIEVGCAVGGACLELAKDFAEVTGVDLSSSFIATARHIQQSGECELFVREEGELGYHRQLQLDTASTLRERINFLCADACKLPEGLAGYDAVLAVNLLCRLAEPAAFLNRIAMPNGLLRPGGILVLVSPYTWSEDYTPRHNWLGGTTRNDKTVYGREGIRHILGKEFELIREQDVPLMIREHQRKYQFIVSHAMVLQRCKA